MSVVLAHRVAGALLPCATLAAALTLVACGGSSDPVIVSGKIETYGDEVGVAVYRGSDHYESDPIDYRQSKGDFELRGTMPASDARDFFLTVFPPTPFPHSCGAIVNLPPLRLSEGAGGSMQAQASRSCSALNRTRLTH
jgi:hypothetical protein